jgi:hypothetical protein
MIVSPSMRRTMQLWDWAMVARSRESANLAKKLTIFLGAESYEAVAGRAPDPSDFDETRGGYAVKLNQETVDRLSILELSESLSHVIATAGDDRRRH